MAKDSLAIEPLISICIPAYNCEKYIRETLNCLCAQTYHHIEIIVVNDGSTDDTENLVKEAGDKRITLLNVTNGGAARARNTAYQNAKGDYIIFFDADDFVKPDFIAKQLDKIQGRKDAVVLALWGRFYNDDLHIFKLNDTPVNEMTFKEWIKIYWYHCNPMTNPGRVLIPAVLIEQAGLWNESLNLNDDLEFFTRVFLKTGKIIFNHDAVFYYRSGINGLSGEKSADAYQSAYNSLALSINYVMSAYTPDKLLLKSCANMWQIYLYELYPRHKTLVKKMSENIKQLKGADLKYPSGGYTKLMVSLIGWKTTKHLKRLFNL